MPQRIRIAIAGCGRVSEHYIPRVMSHPTAEVVALCDGLPGRAQDAAARHGVAHAYEDLERMLDEERFDLLVNLTSMQSHGAVTRTGLEHGRHVFSEKPLAGSYAEGKELLALARERGLNLWAAPYVAGSPAFREMHAVMQRREIGDVHAAYGCYGHGGPNWGTFYQKGAGALADLGVYNITTLTGLLGPVKSVVAISGIAVPERIVQGKPIRVEAEDNIMLLMDHGNAVFSSVQTGFVYRAQKDDFTLHLAGTKGAMALLGYDWAPRGVSVWTEEQGAWTTRAVDQKGYHWSGGLNHVIECLATGKKPVISGEQALHVVEVMEAARRSAETGRRVEIDSDFPPLVFE